MRFIENASSRGMTLLCSALPHVMSYRRGRRKRAERRRGQQMGFVVLCEVYLRACVCVCECVCVSE